MYREMHLLVSTEYEAVTSLDVHLDCCMHAWLGPHDKLKARFLLLRTWTVRCESLPTHCSSSICLAKQCSVRETTRPAAYHQSHLYYRLIVPPPPPPSSVAIWSAVPPPHHGGPAAGGGPGPGPDARQHKPAVSWGTTTCFPLPHSSLSPVALIIYYYCGL